MSLNQMLETEIEIEIAPTVDPAQSGFEEFHRLLEHRREQIDTLARATVGNGMGLSRDDLADEIDHASSETMAAFEFRLRTREHQLLRKILIALDKIDAGTFGECEDCGDPIGLARLRARPEAPLCILCKEAEERKEGMTGE